MQKEIRERIRAAKAACGAAEPEFADLLQQVEQDYDKLELTLTQTMHEQGLQDSNSIEAIFDSVTEALLSINADGIIRNYNKVCTHYFGMEEKQLIGAHIARLIPAAKGKPIADFLAPFLSNLDDTGIKQVGGEVEAMRADGQVFLSELNATKLPTTAGLVFVISLRDVTERRQAETALRENEERYRALVENAPEAIIVFDVDNHIFTDANEIACQLFNLSRARLLTLGPAAISPEMQPDGTKSFGVRRGYVERALNGEHPIFEWMHQDSRGKPLPCEVRFSRLPSDDRSLIRVSVT
ncbi:MAG: PAS domain S-box protein, partial [Woeseiaceae bacterium]